MLGIGRPAGDRDHVDAAYAQLVGPAQQLFEIAEAPRADRDGQVDVAGVVAVDVAPMHERLHRLLDGLDAATAQFLQQCVFGRVHGNADPGAVAHQMPPDVGLADRAVGQHAELDAGLREPLDDREKVPTQQALSPAPQIDDTGRRQQILLDPAQHGFAHVQASIRHHAGPAHAAGEVAPSRELQEQDVGHAAHRRDAVRNLTLEYLVVLLAQVVAHRLHGRPRSQLHRLGAGQLTDPADAHAPSVGNQLTAGDLLDAEAEMLQQRSLGGAPVAPDLLHLREGDALLVLVLDAVQEPPIDRARTCTCAARGGCRGPGPRTPRPPCPRRSRRRRGRPVAGQPCGPSSRDHQRSG